MANKKFNKILIALAFIPLIFPVIAFAQNPPVVNAGPDKYLVPGTFSGSYTTLEGSGYNPTGGTVSFYWNCTGGNLSDRYIAAPAYSAPYNAASSDVYICTLTVTNSSGVSASDSTTIYLDQNRNANTCNINLETLPATNNSSGQATLNGKINKSSSLNCGTTYIWFQWGTSQSYGYETQTRPTGNDIYFDQHIAGLVPNTTYHYRIVGQNNLGLLYGQDVVFISQPYIAVTYVAPPASVYTGQVAGATSIAAGVEDNFSKEFFLIPVLILAMLLWLYFSGKIDKLVKWLSHRFVSSSHSRER